jgi:hypothetical protein
MLRSRIEDELEELLEVSSQDGISLVKSAKSAKTLQNLTRTLCFQIGP